MVSALASTAEKDGPNLFASLKKFSLVVDDKPTISSRESPLDAEIFSP